jgi:hypothetical protein
MMLPELIRKRNREAKHARGAGDLETALAKLAELRALRDALCCSVDDLKRYAMLPKDAPKHCVCDDPKVRTLPAWLSRQALALRPDSLEAKG